MEYAVEAGEPTLGGVTELRVHGVGGTSPSTMLFDPAPVRVAGDDVVGFYRTADINGRHVEAYSWGGLTSRSQWRSLWLLLLPFALLNVAGWAQRSAPSASAQKDPRASLTGRLVAILGLTLTTQLVFGVVSAATDIASYQCGAQTGCIEQRWWLSPLDTSVFREQEADDEEDDDRPGRTYPGRRVAAAMLVPLVVVVGLNVLAWRTRRRYEELEAQSDWAAGEQPKLVVARPSTWAGAERNYDLSGIHRVAALAAMAGVTASATAALADAQRDDAPFADPVIVAAVVLGACAVLLLSWPNKVVRRVALILSSLTLVVAVAQAAALPATTETLPVGPLPGADRAGELLFLVQLVLLAALAIVGVATWTTNRAKLLPAFRWHAPLVAAALAILMLGSAVSGAIIRLADYLGKPVAEEEKGATAGAAKIVIGYPSSYDWAAVAFACGVAALVVIAVVVAVRVRRVAETEVTATIAEYDEREGNLQPDDPAERNWAASIVRARNLAEEVRQLDRPLSLVVVGVLLAVLVAYALRLRLDPFRLEPLPPIDGWWHWAQTAASWFVALLPIGGVLLIRRSWSGEGSRRQLGVLWDVATYWPRWFHPWAPPCYAERAVPELQRRLITLTSNGGSVVLSAHSQGSILAVTALRLVPPKVRERIALVTYGSPLSHLYRRAFPDHFGRGELRTIASELAPVGAPQRSRWTNYWRRTDPIGGEVFIEQDEADDADIGVAGDVSLHDPARRRSPVGSLASAAGHSHYIEDPTVSAHVEAVAAAFRGAVRTTRVEDAWRTNDG